MEQKDIFLCHASENKDEIVGPIAEALQQAGISFWYDEAEIVWGDSISHKVNEGLRKSRFAIVVLSAAFLSKSWPQRELDAILNIEASKGEVKVLPLIVGSEQERRLILEEYPLLNDKRYLPWDGDLPKIVQALQSRLGQEDSGAIPQSQDTNVAPRIPLPKVKKHFSQRDRDLFLREALATVKSYFKRALTELDSQNQEIQTDFMEVHNFKFRCTVYLRGEVSSRCKIWLGGMRSSDSICYATGEFSIDSDNSYNDMLSVSDDDQTLGFSPSGMWLGGLQDSREELLNATEAAEHLWRRFTENLS
ncbi:MAG: toll/interleukin-1 receptor domain-containing protein [Phycisphaerae bacterium]|jgi:hypothetical protein|nr:toll/interleukin-1 receptor domain-containing protein [Phycisphaerae bacterium]